MSARRVRSGQWIARASPRDNWPRSTQMIKPPRAARQPSARAFPETDDDENRPSGRSGSPSGAATARGTTARPSGVFHLLGVRVARERLVSFLSSTPSRAAPRRDRRNPRNRRPTRDPRALPPRLDHVVLDGDRGSLLRARKHQRRHRVRPRPERHRPPRAMEGPTDHQGHPPRTPSTAAPWISTCAPRRERPLRRPGQTRPRRRQGGDR